MANEVSKLVDQFGVPFLRADIDRLKSEEAAPSAYSGRPPYADNLAFNMDPVRLGRVFERSSISLGKAVARGGD